MGFLLWLIFDVVFSSILEVLFGISKAFDSDRDLRVVALLWFAMLGLGGGLLTGVVIPERLLDPGPFAGVSLLVVPFALAVVMHTWGAISSRRNNHTSHLATWYGGTTLGLGLAAGRLIVLEFIRDVRVV